MTSYLIKSSFPKVVVGNLLFVGVVPLQNARSPSPAGRLLPSGITLFLIVIPGVDPGSSLFIRKTPYFISGFQVPACMRALE